MKSKIQESDHTTKLLVSISLGYIYRKWDLKNEKNCMPTCNTYGYDRDTRIKCDGCHHAYHYLCLKKETEMTKKRFTKTR